MGTGRVGGCELECKSGCFDRVTLSDDDGRCNHSFSTQRPLGVRQAGRGPAAGIKPGGPPQFIGSVGQPNGTTIAQQEAKRARPQLHSPAPRAMPPFFWVLCTGVRRQPAPVVPALPPPPFGPGHYSSVDFRHSKWQYIIAMVVLNPNQNPTSNSSSEAASRMSAQYISSPYVQPQPYEVNTYTVHIYRMIVG